MSRSEKLEKITLRGEKLGKRFRFWPPASFLSSLNNTFMLILVILKNQKWCFRTNG